MRAVVCAAVIAMAAASPALAADWLAVAGTETGTSYSVQSDFAGSLDEDFDVWIKGDHSRDRVEKARSSMSKVRINCASRKMAWVSITEYDGEGRTLGSRSDFFAKVEENMPETVGEFIVRNVCALYRARAK